LGYRSFLTTHAGFNRPGTDVFSIRRRIFFANDDTWIVRYLIAHDW
jgi:hypothetical protein